MTIKISNLKIMRYADDSGKQLWKPSIKVQQNFTKLQRLWNGNNAQQAKTMHIGKITTNINISLGNTQLEKVDKQRHI